MRHWIAMAALILSATPSQAYRVGQWTIESSTDLCHMRAGYVDGTLFSLAVNKSYGWGIGLTNPKWKLNKNATTDVAVFIDGRFIASGKAKHINEQTAILPLEGVSTYQALRRGYQLKLQTPLGDLYYALTDTAKAMIAVLNCVKGLPRGSPSQTANSVPQDNELLSQSEASQLLSKMLASSGLSGYAIDPPSEGNIVTYSLGDGSRGLFWAARGINTKGADEQTGFVISSWSSGCKGEFLSGKKSIPSLDGSVIRRVITTCRMPERSVSTQTTIIRRSDGFLMELTSVAPEGVASVDHSGETSGDGHALVDAAMRLPTKP